MNFSALGSLQDFGNTSFLNSLADFFELDIQFLLVIMENTLLFEDKLVGIAKI